MLASAASGSAYRHADPNGLAATSDPGLNRALRTAGVDRPSAVPPVMRLGSAGRRRRRRAPGCADRGQRSGRHRAGSGPRPLPACTGGRRSRRGTGTAPRGAHSDRSPCHRGLLLADAALRAEPGKRAPLPPCRRPGPAHHREVRRHHFPRDAGRTGLRRSCRGIAARLDLARRRPIPQPRMGRSQEPPASCRYRAGLRGRHSRRLGSQRRC